LESINVSADKESAIFGQQPDNAKSTNVLNKKAIEQIGGPAQTNYYKAIDVLPGVNVQTSDAYGISSGQNIKVRGKSSFHIGRTIEDVPLTGIVGTNGMGGGELFELENISEISLYKGAIPSDKGFSLSTSTGVVNADILKPSDKLELMFKQSSGTENFRRTFTRIDSGKLPSDSSFFVSYSNTSGDKWKGEGGSPDGKENVNFGFTQKFGDRATANVYAAYNNVKLHSYRSLTYAQASDLDKYYDYDYNSQLTNSASENAQYYDYNKQEFESYGVIGDIKVKLADNIILTVKPHYWKEDGFTLSGSGTTLTLWDIIHEQYGVLTKLDSRIFDTDFALGYSFMDMQAPPPPVYQKQYTVGSDGSLSNYKYKTLSSQSDNILNSYFVTAAKKISDFKISGGLKYLVWKTADLQYYTNTTSLSGNLSYESALSNAIADPRQRVNSTTYNKLLPNLSIDYKITPRLSTAFQYSKTYGRPDWGPQASAYQSASAGFKATHTMQDIFDVLKPEMADNYEWSLTYDGHGLHLKPVMFYSKYTDKEVSVYDTSAGQSYNMSASKAKAYGIEAEMAYSPWNELSLFCSPSYTESKFDNDTTVSSTQTLITKGKQLPDIPKILVKIGATYQYGNFYITPLLRYSDKRYGDAENNQKVGAYAVTDIHLGYSMKNVLSAKELSFNASLLNIFNRKYVGIISSNDLSLNGSTSYSAGAPFAAVASMSLKF
ncbi:MAG: TonB-dependent receptor, partial [Campylobacterales bacterium]|nr:TonB-dependent receptor [Campylobacterales bacterium]